MESKDNGVSMPWYRGLTGYHWLVLIVASLGWAFDTMDQWIFNLAKGPAIADLLSLTTGAPEVNRLVGWATAVFILGWATGGFVFGMVGDKLGRTRTMMLTVGMYAVFTGLSGLAQSATTFIVYRFLTGLGIGGEFAAGAALIAEVFPDRSRATALGVMQACSALGNITAGVIDLAVHQYVVSFAAWRVMFLIGVAPALLTVVVRLFVHEPERWHQAREAALAADKGLGTLSELFREPVLRGRTLVGVALAAVGVIGFWGIGVFTPELFRDALNPQNLPELQRSVEQQKSVCVIMQQVGAFFGILAWTWVAERVGRRAAFALAFLGCLVVVPLCFHFTTSFITGLIWFPLLGFMVTSLFGGYAIYFPELYPTRLRATGTGFCYNVARYISVIGPIAFGSLAASVGFKWAATVISVVFVFGLLTLIWAPETHGQPLPED